MRREVGEVYLLHCPVCGEEGDYRGLHLHLKSLHPETVAVGKDGPKRYFEVRCPLCSERYRQGIKTGKASEEFVEEFEGDIRLVGSDILLQHLIGEHPDRVGIAADNSFQ